ncbi:ABC transporter ATP-binding protein [Corynebacterium zhongnanshanii]|uniref:ABC transporter ATP-binding protein n=1 Tax=Corynebacterium zhongnanshanii TaxID=2768834 RepID=A0ABQ6VE88_9CORY|nr:ABC transporter ATP-binding protein [Corynebacterium zhongnanshanii]KAB3519888.1 ABC transporter ATP-binding protein [Corynebacterium zhongnanshanii]
MSTAFPLATWGQTRREVSRHAARIPGARWKTALAVALLCLGAWCTVMMPQLLGQVVDVVRGVHASSAGDTAFSATASEASRDLLIVALKMLGVALCGGVAQGAGFYVLSVMCERVIADLRTTMVGTALGLPLHQVEDAGTGELVSRSTDDVAQVSASVSETLPILATSVFTIGATSVALLTLDPRLLLVAVVTVPIYVWAARNYLRVAPGRYARERAWMATRARWVLEAIHGRRTVREFRLESVMHGRIERASEAVVTTGVRARMSMMVLQIWMTVCEFVLVAGVLAIGLVLVRWDVVTVGAVTAAALMMIRIRGPIMQLMRVLDTVQSGYASLARIVGVVIDPPAPVPGGAAPERRGCVELDGVSFAYSGQDAAQDHAAASAGVKDISFVIEPGQMVAVVGASGAGKSTVASLLVGLRVPDVGRVLVDGVAVSSLSDAERASRVAMVSQEVHTFSGSLREDLSIAREQASDEEMLRALEQVGAARWVGELAQGLDTQVGAMGVRLDPVQSQQVALARVLLMDPAVVVMDEATAEAGSAAAGELELAAERVVEGRSALVVAHRLDQAMRADVVMVMDEGRVVESGSHEELLAAGGRYSRLWAAWSAHVPDNQTGQK